MSAVGEVEGEQAKKHVGIVIVGHVDSGKCHGRDTPILMHDGTIKKVQDVISGDEVMGDNSQPRKVLTISSGEGQLYRIISNKTDSYVVNENHILSLKVTNMDGIFYDKSRNKWRARWMKKTNLVEKRFNTKEEAELYLNEHYDGRIYYQDVVDIPLKTYLKLPTSVKDIYKTYSVAVEWDEKRTSIPPYILGYWLGDGTSVDSSITTIDKEIIQHFANYAEEIGMELKLKGKCCYRITSGVQYGPKNRNIFLNHLRQMNLLGNKHIPEHYKITSRKNRLNLLAGLLDSDGHRGKGYYEFTQKRKDLFDEVIFIARSLGFCVTQSEKIVVNQKNEPITYYRMHISGNDLCTIPCLLERKKIHKRNTKKNACMHGFCVEKVEDERKYYGFGVDGNHRYLLGDFMVTHNSTTTGRLLFELGGLKERELEKLKAEAESLGKGSFAFAFFMDRQKDERERGVTISCTTKEFFTKTKHYTIIDAPGHRDFIKNMINGASQADVALLMVPANKGGFETAIQKGDHKEGIIQGQTRQHAKLCYLLGIEQVIVGVNKMDDPTVNYSEERYIEIKDEMVKMLKGFGYKPKQIPFIPMSGWTGENLSIRSDKMPWFKGWAANISPKETVKGATLIEALEDFVRIPKRQVDAKLRIPVSGVYKIKGVGDVITGRVEQGVLKPKETIGFTPTGVEGTVFTIEMHHKNVEHAYPGDNVGLNVKGLDKANMPRVGDVIYANKVEHLDPIDTFVVQVMIQDHPGQLKASTDKVGGFTPLIHSRTAKAPCMMCGINWRMSKKTGNKKMENPPYVEAGDTAEVEFKAKMPFYLEPYAESKGLGRIAVMDSNTLIMLGKVISATYKENA